MINGAAAGFGGATVGRGFGVCGATIVEPVSGTLSGAAGGGGVGAGVGAGAGQFPA